MAAESELEKECRQLALDAGGELLKWVRPGVRGVPDRILLMPNGFIVFIEFKAPGEKPKPWQDRWLKRLRTLGFDAVVVWEVSQFKQLLGFR